MADLSKIRVAVIANDGFEEAELTAKGRTMNSYYTIQDDIRDAGATWVDQEVVVDGNLVTSRQPSDIPAFNREMLKLFSQVPSGAGR